MNLDEEQRQLIDDYLLIEDPMERFSAIVDRARHLPGLTAQDRTEANLVPGCRSQVWMTAARAPDGAGVRFRSDADSTILKAIAALMAELYSGHPPEAIQRVEPVFIEKLRLDAHLSPTRRNGLQQIRRRMVELASGFVQEGGVP